MPERALLVVDMLRGFYNIGPLATPRLENIIGNVEELIAREVKRNSLVVFINDAHGRGDKELLVRPEHCMEGTEEAQIISGLWEAAINALAGTTGLVFEINKRTYCGFYQTDLEEILEEFRVRKVAVVGDCTDICVIVAVIGLVIRGYEVTVLTDCVETYDGPDHPAEELHAQALSLMKRSFLAKTMTMKEYLAENP